MNENVQVSIEVNQVEDGRVYTGTATFDDVRFDYTLVFRVPVGTLSKSALSGRELARRVSIVASRGRNRLEITEDETDLFVATVVPHAMSFYQDRETRAAQEGVPGYLLRKGLIVDGARYRPFSIKRDPVLDAILENRRRTPYAPAYGRKENVLFELSKLY